MTKRLVLAFVVVVLATVAWWRYVRHVHEAASPATATDHSSGALRTAGVPATAGEQAHAIVTVKDDKGPLAGATVRFGESDGDVVIATTGTDGVAHVELAAGSWKIGASAADHEPGAAPAQELHADETARVTIVLTAGGLVLTGVITDATGGPIGGARVDAAKLDALASASDAVATVQTGADGRYKLAVASGQLLVAANHPDYAPQSRYVEVRAANTTADFKLVPGSVIEGIVRDEHTREPVAAAEVEARRDEPALFGESSQRHATSGADGRFRITGLRPGTIELAAHATARYSHAPTVVGLGVAEQVSNIEILVGTGRAIRGIVIDEAGAPAPNVVVSSFGADDNDARSDAKGAFALEGLAPGRYQLLGEGEGLVPAGYVAVEVTDKDVDGVRVAVRRGGQVHGHVEPREICEVRLDFDDHSLGPAEMPMLVPPITTGPDGEFAFRSASPTGYVLAARCPNGDQGSEPVKVVPELPDLVLPVTPGASITGRVVDGAGKPVVAVTVMAVPQSGSERTTVVNGIVTSGAQSLASATGAFELRGLTAATYRLRLLDRGRPLPMKTADAATVFSLGATDHKTGVELAVDRPDGTIRGTVTSADGKPLGDAWVSVSQGLDDMLAGMQDHAPDGPNDSHMITVEAHDDGTGGAAGIAPVLADATGHFEITGLARSPWTVTAEAHAGASRGRVEHVTPDATITVQMSGVIALHGVVHAAGPPPPAFTVVLDGPTHAERTFLWDAGAFAFDRVDPGAYTVTVTSTAGNGDANVQVAAGVPATADITLAANAIITGKLVDASGKPVGGIPVTTVPDDGGGKVRVEMSGPSPTSAPDGTFRLEIKAGTIIVVAMVPPSPVMKRGVIAQAGKTIDVGSLVVPTP